MQLPEKEYLTFSELCEKWKCSGDSLFHQITTEKIIPSIFVRGKHEKMELRPSDDGGLEMHGLIDEEIDQNEWVYGIHYLTWGSLRSVHRYVFSCISKKRVPEEFDVIFALETPIEIEAFPELGNFSVGEIIFVRDEIARFELEHVRKNIQGDNNELNTNGYREVDTSNKQEKTLGTHERNNLLKIIKALCAAQGLDLKQPYKDAEIIKNQIELLGGSLSLETIADKLEQAKQS